MKENKLSNAILILGVLAALAMILYPSMAHATGSQVDPASSVAKSAASAGAKSASHASSAIDLSMANNPRGGNSYSFMSGGAAPLPGGLCPKGDTRYVKILWGALEVDFSTTRSEMECLDKVLAMLRETAPKPVVVNYVAPEPKVEQKPAEQARTADPASLAPYCYKSPPKAAPKKKVHRQCRS